jgi:hypothetical protein
MSLSGRMPVVTHRKRQRASCVEAGSLGAFLLKTHGVKTHGVERVKAVYRASLRAERAWQASFDSDLPALESRWLGAVEEYGRSTPDQVDALVRIWKRDPRTACEEAQGVRSGPRPRDPERRRPRWATRGTWTLRNSPGRR